MWSPPRSIKSNIPPPDHHLCKLRKTNQSGLFYFSNMNKKHTLIDYEARIKRVIAYIYDHLDEDLNVDRLAEIACFSSWHWHRIYRGLTGETAVQTIRRLRLHRAAAALVQGEHSIEQIAQKAGYGSVEAFHRAFVKDYHIPPAAYRKQAIDQIFPAPVLAKDEQMKEVEIRKLDPIKLVCIPHKGSYMEIGKAFYELVVWASARGLGGKGSRIIGIYFDDPKSVAEKDLRALAGGVVEADFEFELDDDKVVFHEIAGGRTAVLLHKGPYEQAGRSYDWFYGTWLPQSGEQPADAPMYEEYLNDPQTTPPAELLTEICMPLKD